MHKRVLALVMSITLLASISQSTTVFATPDYDSQLQEQKTELSEHKKKYAEAQEKVQKIQVEIEKLDVKIEALLSEIEETENKIKELEAKIQESKDKIKETEDEMKKEKDMYNNRMVAMYMTGGTSYLEVILGAESITDFFSRIQTVTTLSDLDEEILARLEAKQVELEEQKAKLSEENATLKENKESLEAQKVEIEKDKDDQQVLIDDAKKEASKIASLVQSDQNDIAKIQELINAANGISSTPSRGTAPVSSNAVVSYAYKYLGTPYRYGATGPNRFDCSGFAQYVYAHFGVSIPRTSSSQSRYGSYVSRSNLQPGDLVFFGHPVHHVGIYVGNNSYIHAPHTGDVVKISTLSYRSDYNCARRVR